MSATDVEAIENIIRSMFAAIQWSRESRPDWCRFGESVLPNAIVIPSRRPLIAGPIKDFVDRMRALHEGGGVHTFEEEILGIDTKVFGGVAVSRAAYRSSMNDQPRARGVNAFLFVKSDEGWAIACLAWDEEGNETPIPQDLLQLATDHGEPFFWPGLPLGG